MSATKHEPIEIVMGDGSALAAVMEIMRDAFDPAYGEAWNTAQCAAILAGTGTWLLIAEQGGRPVGFALTRAIAGEAELLLIAVHPRVQGRGLGTALLRAVIDECHALFVEKLFLEVRACNNAIAFYINNGFRKVGERPSYYRGMDGKLFDAHSYSLQLKI